MAIAYWKDFDLLRELWLDENNYTKIQREDMAYKLAEHRECITDMCEDFNYVDDLIDNHKDIKKTIKKR